MKTTEELPCEVCKAFPPHGGGMWFQGFGTRSKWVCVDERACAAAYGAVYDATRRRR